MTTHYSIQIKAEGQKIKTVVKTDIATIRRIRARYIKTGAAVSPIQTHKTY